MDTIEDAASPVQVASADGDTQGMTEAEKSLLKRIAATIRSDKEHHKKAFERMRRDMFVAAHGYIDGEYPGTSYKANIAGRHIQQSTAALYAKNPKVVARRREQLDFQVWDENPQSLQAAMQGVTMAQQAMAATPQAPDPVTGEAVPVESPVPPEFEAAFEQARAVLADYSQGMQRRKMMTSVGRTLEILMAQAFREQKPVDFKTGAKQLVRRAKTTGVGYIELGFQRETGPRPEMAERLTDARQRIDHLQRLSDEAAEGEFDENDAEMAELNEAIAALQAEPEIVLREGLIFDFPQSTKVIPDQRCQNLVGFVGARHLTLEYPYTPGEVREMFGVDLNSGSFNRYSPNGKLRDDSANRVPDISDEDGTAPAKEAPDGLVCVWKYFHKPSGLVYVLADGYDKWLRAPAPPDVFVEDFWPVYALTFNAVENEKELFPPSDVALMLDMQMEYNRSRQGMREHRKAARPRWAYPNGAFDEGDIEKFKTAQPFEVFGLNKSDPTAKLADLLEVVPVPGVDPNLYETGQLFTDIQLVVGTQEAQLGGVSQATATESAIAASSSASASGSAVDDLDAFLTMVSRASGQILLREMSEEQVKQIVGPGAVWPHLSLAEIADEIFLEVEAGSTGKPNQAIELNNFQTMLPFLLQMEGINPVWLARESLRRLDDKMDLTEALTEGMPSMVALNAMRQAGAQPQAGTGDAATDPASQGAEGGNNVPAAPRGEGGSEPAFGSNQV